MIFDQFRDRITFSYSTRHGGVSTGCYESMNLSNTMGDDPERVRENYRLWLAANGADISDVVSVMQAHGDRILVADETLRGSGPIEGRIGDSCGKAVYDGLVTNVPGVCLVTGHADCTPIFLYDPVRSAVGMIHAGWRGTTLEIAARAVETLRREYGTSADDIYAYIGPCIHQQAFECDADVIEAIDAMSIDGSPYYRFDEATDKYHASIPHLNRALLTASGVREERIEVSPECTFELADKYFSHRRQGIKRGGQAAMIMLRRKSG